MSGLTKQAIFDRVCKGLASQGFERSVVNKPAGEECAYRGFDDRRCAAGWLLPDKNYDESMEGWTIGEHADVDFERFGIRRESHKALVTDLQGAHDNGHNPGLMVTNLVEVGLEHGLRRPACLRMPRGAR